MYLKKFHKCHPQVADFKLRTAEKIGFVELQIEVADQNVFKKL
jgi:hypothetical protein